MRRRIFGRRRSYGRKRFGGLKRKAVGRARARVFKRRVRRIVDASIEKKYFDAAVNNIGVNNTGQVSYMGMDNILSGTGEGQRIGNDIRYKSLAINLTIDSVSGYPVNRWRVIVGCWKDYIFSAPNATQILANTTTSLINSLYNRTTLERKQWIPMYDGRFTTQYGQMNQIKKIRLKFFGKRLPMKRVNYTSSTTPRSVYFLLVINDTVGSTPYPFYNYYSRMTYVDA